MVIFNCLAKGFVKVDGDFSVATVTKNVLFYQEGERHSLSKEKYIELIKSGANVKCPCEIGDLIITTSTNRYIFQDTTLSIDDSVYITDEILSCLSPDSDEKCQVILIDCPNENSEVEFPCNGNLITEKL